jgi:hypothetical protein
VVTHGAGHSGRADASGLVPSVEIEFHAVPLWFDCDYRGVVVVHVGPRAAARRDVAVAARRSIQRGMGGAYRAGWPGHRLHVFGNLALVLAGLGWG